MNNLIQIVIALCLMIPISTAFALAQVKTFQDKNPTKDDGEARYYQDPNSPFDDPEIVRECIVALMRNQKEICSQAVDELTTEIDWNPENLSMYYFSRGRIYQMMEILSSLGSFAPRKMDLSKALSDFNKAIEIDSKNSAASIHRAKIYKDYQQQNKLALADYSKAIESSPPNAELYWIRSTCYLDMGKSDESIQDMSKAIELDPSNHGYHFVRGGMYVKTKNYLAAINDFTSAFELTATKVLKANYLLERGDVQYKINNVSKAIADYRNAIKLNPDLKNYFRNRAVNYRMTGKIDLAKIEEKNAAEILTKR